MIRLRTVPLTASLSAIAEAHARAASRARDRRGAAGGHSRTAEPCGRPGGQVCAARAARRPADRPRCADGEICGTHVTVFEPTAHGPPVAAANRIIALRRQRWRLQREAIWYDPANEEQHRTSRFLPRYCRGARPCMTLGSGILLISMLFTSYMRRVVVKDQTSSPIFSKGAGPAEPALIPLGARVSNHDHDQGYHWFVSCRKLLYHLGRQAVVVPTCVLHVDIVAAEAIMELPTALAAAAAIRRRTTALADPLAPSLTVSVPLPGFLVMRLFLTSVLSWPCPAASYQSDAAGSEVTGTVAAGASRCQTLLRAVAFRRIGTASTTGPILGRVKPVAGRTGQSTVSRGCAAQLCGGRFVIHAEGWQLNDV